MTRGGKSASVKRGRTIFGRRDGKGGERVGVAIESREGVSLGSSRGVEGWTSDPREGEQDRGEKLSNGIGATEDKGVPRLSSTGDEGGCLVDVTME